MRKRFLSLALISGILMMVPLEAQTLRQSAETRGKRIGVAWDDNLQYWTNAVTGWNGLKIDRDYYSNTIVTNFNLLVPERCMKIKDVHPGVNAWRFESMNTMFRVALQNDLKIRATCMVWHRGLPAWVSNLTPGEPSRAALSNHIEGLMRYTLTNFPGMVIEWDIVNEAVADDTDPAFPGLRSTLWRDKIGDDYIAWAFQCAQTALARIHADHPGVPTDVKLFYNDYDNETTNAKSRAILSLLNGIRARGIQVDGVGMQMHWGAGWGADTTAAVAANMAEFIAHGYLANITEIDLSIPMSNASGLSNQAYNYREMAKLVADTAQSTSFLCWGVTDRHSWLNGGEMGSNRFAHFFDYRYAPKRAVQEIVSEWSPTRGQTNYLAGAPRPGQGHPLPGVIQAEDFDAGSAYASFHDNHGPNAYAGATYRADTAIEVQNGGGGRYVGYPATGRWLEYTVDVTQDGPFWFDLTAAVTAGSTAKIALEADSKHLALLSLASTGGYSTFATVRHAQAVSLGMGRHILRLRWEQGPGNIDSFSLTPVVVDQRAPQVTVSPASALTATNLIVRISTDEDHGWYAVLGQAYSPVPRSSPVALILTQSTTLLTYGLDTAGNRSATGTNTYLFDREAPIPTNSIQGSPTAHAPLSMLLGAGDGTLHWTTNQGATWGQAPAGPGVRIDVSNTTFLSYFASDDLGNRSATNTQTFTLTPDFTLWVEAEQAASFTAPLMLSNSPYAISGAYLYVDADSHAYTPPTNGVATYPFTLPLGGAYAIWARVKAETYTNDSLYFAVDQAPESNASLGIGDWHWRKLTATGPLNLAAGAHELRVARREIGAAFDQIYITSDTNFDPSLRDQVAPVVTVTGWPASNLVDVDVTLGLSVNEPQGFFTLDGGAIWAPIPPSGTNLLIRHSTSFATYAVDAAGNHRSNAYPSLTRIAHLRDDLSNMNLIASAGEGPFIIDTSDSNSFYGDPHRLKRVYPTTNWVAYVSPSGDWRTFEAVGFALRNAASAVVFRFYASPDGVSWNPLTDVCIVESTRPNWDRRAHSGAFPPGSRFFKIEYDQASGANYILQLGSVALTYEVSPGGAPAAPAAVITVDPSFQTTPSTNFRGTLAVQVAPTPGPQYARARSLVSGGLVFRFGTEAWKGLYDAQSRIITETTQLYVGVDDGSGAVRLLRIMDYTLLGDPPTVALKRYYSISGDGLAVLPIRSDAKRALTLSFQKIHGERLSEKRIAPGATEMTWDFTMTDGRMVSAGPVLAILRDPAGGAIIQTIMLFLVP